MARTARPVPRRVGRANLWKGSRLMQYGGRLRAFDFFSATPAGRAAALARGAPFASRLALRRAIRSTTSADCGVARSSRRGLRPLSFAWITFIKLSRYSSVSGFHLALRLSMSWRAMFSSAGRIPSALGKRN